LELDARARVESISRGLSEAERGCLVAIASGKFESVNKIVLEKFMGLDLIKHGPDGLGITLDGIRVVAFGTARVGLIKRCLAPTWAKIRTPDGRRSNAGRTARWRAHCQ